MKNTVDCMQNQPLVSIIIPTYRRDLSLLNALKSLSSQTYSNIEVILIDDNCNKDWNLKVNWIVNQSLWIHQGNFVYIVNDKNRGSAKSRNIGIEKARGDYISFLDDDDIYMPDKIESQVKDMIKSKAEYSLTDLWLYNEKRELIEKRKRQSLKVDLTTKELLKIHFMYHLTGTNVLMFERKYLNKIGGFDSVDVGDEFYLMQKAIENEGKLSYLRGCSVISIIHYEKSGLSSGESKIKGEVELFKHKEKFFNIFDASTIRYIRMRHYAVLSFVELRRGNLKKFLVLAIKCFITSPISSFKLFLERKQK